MNKQELVNSYETDKKNKTFTLKRVKEVYLPELMELKIIDKFEFDEVVANFHQAFNRKDAISLIFAWNYIHWYMTECWRSANGLISLKSYHEQRNELIDNHMN